VVEQRKSYKLDEDEASVLAPAGVGVVEASGKERGTALEVPVSVLAELSDGAGPVGDASSRALSGVDVSICAGVDVEKTNGGAFSM
jgi:hypothetical protein